MTAPKPLCRCFMFHEPHESTKWCDPSIPYVPKVKSQEAARTEPTLIEKLQDASKTNALAKGAIPPEMAEFVSAEVAKAPPTSPSVCPKCEGPLGKGAICPCQVYFAPETCFRCGEMYNHENHGHNGAGKYVGLKRVGQHTFERDDRPDSAPPEPKEGPYHANEWNHPTECEFCVSGEDAEFEAECRNKAYRQGQLAERERLEAVIREWDDLFRRYGNERCQLSESSPTCGVTNGEKYMCSYHLEARALREQMTALSSQKGSSDAV